MFHCDDKHLPSQLKLISEQTHTKKEKRLCQSSHFKHLRQVAEELCLFIQIYTKFPASARITVYNKIPGIVTNQDAIMSSCFFFVTTNNQTLNSVTGLYASDVIATLIYTKMSP